MADPKVIILYVSYQKIDSCTPCKYCQSPMDEFEALNVLYDNNYVVKHSILTLSSRGQKTHYVLEKK